MLPGFRFLFAAIVLSVSVLIFGLGAAALLRAKHEEFASIPARRVLPEPYFAQQSETPAPTLAMLRVEPAPQDNAPVSPPAPVLVDEPAPDAVPVPKVETEKLAALNADVAPPVEPAKPEIAATEPPALVAPMAETQAETKIAAIDTTTAPAVETTSAPAEQIVMPAMTDVSSDKPVAKIAALGSPAATVAAPAAETKKASAKSDRSEIRKKQRAERARERRRLAARRARLAAQQAAIVPAAGVQQSADPFGEAATQTQPATARRRR